MSVVLTYEEAVNLARNAVKMKGEDYIYPTAHDENADEYSPGDCHYYDLPEEHGVQVVQPSCLVGWVFFQKDITWEVFSAYGLSNELGVTDVLSNHSLITVDDKTAIFLKRMQELQDMGTPWGEALGEAELLVEEMFPAEEKVDA